MHNNNGFLKPVDLAILDFLTNLKKGNKRRAIAIQRHIESLVDFYEVPRDYTYRRLKELVNHKYVKTSYRIVKKGGRKKKLRCYFATQKGKSIYRKITIPDQRVKNMLHSYSQKIPATN